MLSPLPASDWDRNKAAHLLKRAGFGSSPAELDAWSTLSLEQAVDKLVNWQLIPDNTPNPEWAKPDTTFEQKRQELRKMSEDERKQAIMLYRREQRQHVEEMRLWWLTRMLETPRPLQEKMTLFWHGHFATSVEKVQNAYYMWRQNDIFRRLANGNFEQMLVELGRDPAMLIWLDGEKSNLRAPNENYAREIMELFTLGEGHYTEDDIKNAAKAFTGWIVDRAKEEAVFMPARFSNEDKTFKGQTGNFKDTDIVRLILADPSCAEYLGKKLWTFFAHENPESGLIQALAENLRKNKYELKPFLRTLFLSSEFYSAQSMGNQIKSPVQWLISTCKSLEITRIPRLASNALRLLGQDLLAPPSVKGWDGGRTWISTATLLQRCNIARFMIYGGSPANMGLAPQGFKPATTSTSQATTATITGSQSGPLVKATPGADEKAERQKKFMERMAQTKLPPMINIPALVSTAGANSQNCIHSLAGRLYQGPLNPQLEKNFSDYLGNDTKSVNSEKIQGLLYLMMTRPEFELT